MGNRGKSMSRFLSAPFFFVILWLVVLSFYTMGLSTLYNPSIEGVFSVITSIVVFGVTSVGIKTLMPEMLISLSNNRHPVLKKLMWICFLAGTLAFFYEAITVTLPIFKENKMERETEHFIHYITNFLQISLPLAYLDWRINKNRSSAIIFSLSNILLGMWLSRGFILLLLVTVLVVEYTLYLKNKNIKAIVYIFLILVAFLSLFSFIGNYRVEYAYQELYSFSLNAQYGMSEIYPKWFVWFYIYLTSSIENFNFYIENDNFEWNNGYLLVYPFAKLVSNIFDLDLPQTWEIIQLPKLWYSAGLNVGSYLTSAIHDFGILGLLIYPIAYALLGYFQNYVVKKNNQIMIAVQIYILTLYAWTPFYHSLAMGSLIINLLILIFAATKIKKF